MGRPGWSEAIDRRGDTFYYETGSGFSTYHHPNDTKYKEMAMELKRQLAKRLEAGPVFSAIGLRARYAMSGTDIGAGYG
eukprot:2402151-Rhodomonas_salina.1